MCPTSSLNPGTSQSISFMHLDHTIDTSLKNCRRHSEGRNNFLHLSLLVASVCILYVCLSYLHRKWFLHSREMGHKCFNYCFCEVTDDYSGLILGWSNRDMLKGSARSEFFL